jgi:endonuclease/exonuclease/phosphatase family metal-dependent hydrolase
VNLYGFRFFNRNNTRLLDFTKGSLFSGLTKIGDVIAEIGDLSDINNTSKNFYCSVYDSVLYQSQLVDAYNLSASNVKYTIAPEFSASTIYYAGYYVWHDNELRMFTKDHPVGAWIGTDTASATGFLADLAHVVFMFAVPYDNTKTYAVGDFCTLQNRYLYQCITPIITAEAFTAGHWKRVFFTNVYNDEMKLLHSTIISSNIELNKIVKRFYIPASKNIDVSTITRAVVFNGYLNMYGVRFYNGATMLINFTAGHYFEGYETINGFYGELGDYSNIVDSQTFTCRLFDSVYNEDDIASDYEASRSIKNNTSFGTYTPTAQTGQGNNIGTELMIASYNVAHYNDDVPSVIIPNEKIKNFITEIGKINADILCVQEDNTYIDSNNVRTAKGYLYNPLYPNETGTRETTIKSKIQPDYSGTLTYSNGRWLGYGLYTYGDYKLLAVSSHPIASVDGETTAQAIAARLTQYTEMFKWINGDIDLNEIDISTGTTGSSIHVPTHTHVVIGMDANSLAEDDRTNLANLAEEYGFILGNGGRIGWIRTARSRFEWYSIDNIIVSDNVIINYFEALTSKYSDLYSDHVPVVARVTLT